MCAHPCVADCRCGQGTRAVAIPIGDTPWRNATIQCSSNSEFASDPAPIMFALHQAFLPNIVKTLYAMEPPTMWSISRQKLQIINFNNYSHLVNRRN